MKSFRIKKQHSQTDNDPKKPWRTNTNKEKLLRIDSDLKRHHEKSSEMIRPLADGDMKNLVRECQEETRTALPVAAERLVETVNAAKKNLPNFQYKKIENTTATAILAEAHEVVNPNSSNVETPKCTDPSEC